MILYKKCGDTLSDLHTSCERLPCRYLRSKDAYFFGIGNHDAQRPIEKTPREKCERFEHDDGDAEDYHSHLEKYEKENRVFSAYSSSFLKQLEIWDPTLEKRSTRTTDLNVVFLNTNHRNPYKAKEGYYCIDCFGMTNTLNEMIKNRMHNI